MTFVRNLLKILSALIGNGGQINTITVKCIHYIRNNLYNNKWKTLPSLPTTSVKTTVSTSI